MKRSAAQSEVARDSLLKRNLILVGGYLAVLTLIATAYL
jgi:hypothetical protein